MSLIRADQDLLAGHWTMACVAGCTRLGLEVFSGVLLGLLGEVRPLERALRPTAPSSQCTP